MKIALLALFIGGVAAFFLLDGQRYLTIDAVNANRDALLRFTEEHYAAALAIAFAAYVAATSFSLPAGIVSSLAMGFLFGRWVGTVLMVIAGTTGATILFLAARYIFADAARRRLGAFGARIDAAFTEDAFSYMLFMRLVPVVPYFFVNIAPACTSIPLRTFVLATLIGVIPSSFVFVNLGETLGRIDSVQDLVSFETFGALAMLGVLALAPILVKKYRSRRAQKT